MPLFFIISGILFKPGPLRAFTYKKTVSLMIPYVSFMLIVFVMDNLAGLVSGVPSFLPWSNPKHDIPRMIFGGPLLVQSYTVFWFVSCLWLAQILLNLVGSGSGKLHPAMIALMASLYALSMVERPDIMLPLGIGALPLAIFFIWVGAIWATVRHYRVASLSMGLVAMAALFWFCGPFDMKKVSYGTWANPFFAIASSIVFVSVCYYISRITFISPILVTLGRYSLTIMFLHYIVLVHVGAMIENRYLIALFAIVLPLGIHWLLSRSAFAKGFVLGTPPSRRPVDLKQET